MKTNAKFGVFLAVLLTLVTLFAVLPSAASASEQPRGLEIARFDYVKDNKISVTVTLNDALRSKNGTVLVELFNEHNTLVSSGKSAAFAQYSYTFDKAGNYCGKYIVKVSYLENSTSSTLLCDAVTKELEGRHSFANGWWSTDEHHHWGNCSVCGEISKQNHTFTAEGYCSVCWQTSYTYTDGINYRRSTLENGSECTAENVVVSRKTDNFWEIKLIDLFAFEDNNHIKSVAIPETVTDIQNLAFGGCENLTKVIITNSKIKLYDGAVDGCWSLKEIIFRGTLAEWAEVAKGHDNGLWLVDNVRIVCIDGTLVTGHQLDSAWHYDETNHYHVCSCGEVSDVTPHSFTEHFDDKGSWMQCECGAKNTETFTTHTHSTEWSYDDVAHYHKCDTCEHRGDAALHYYYNDCYPLCVVCGYERNALAHTYSGNCDNTCNTCGHVRNIVVFHKYSSDCDTKCDGCGIAREATAEHTYTSGCDTDCDLCGGTRAAPHTALSEWKTDYYYHWRVCACGEVVSERADHTFGEDGICTVCGDKDKTSKGLTYEEYQRNDYYEGNYVYRTEYYVTGVGTCTDAVIVIPKMHNGKYVSKIKAHAFSDTSFTGIVLPDSILAIETCSFAYSGLKSITIPSKVRFIMSSAFAASANLETVTIEDGMSLEIWLSAFTSCPKLKTINLRKSIREIDMYAITTPNVTINYPGTMAEWGNVDRNAKWAYTDDGKYMCPTIVCTDGTIKDHVYDVEGKFYNEVQHWTKQCACGQPDYSTGDYHKNTNSTACPVTGCDDCNYTGTFHNKVNLKIENEYYAHPENYHYLYAYCGDCKQLVYLNRSSHKMVNKKDAAQHWQGCTGCYYETNKELKKRASYGRI